MLWQRTAFKDYLRADTLQWRLLTTSSTDLLLEMKEKDRDIQRGDTIFRNASEGLAIVDTTGLIHKANAAFNEMVGNPPREEGTLKVEFSRQDARGDFGEEEPI